MMTLRIPPWLWLALVPALALAAEKPFLCDSTLAKGPASAEEKQAKLTDEMAEIYAHMMGPTNPGAKAKPATPAVIPPEHQAGCRALQEAHAAYRDPAKARALLEKAARLGVAEAQLELGRDLIRRGDGTPADQKRGLAWLRSAASVTGYADALFQLGEALDRGWGGPVNRAEAMVNWQAAANVGHRQSLRIVTTKRDIPALRQRAARGDGEALLELSRAFNGGDGVGQDFEEERRVRTRAAEAGNALAQYLHAEEDFRSGEADASRQKMAWMEKAAAQGLPEANYRLGTYLWYFRPDRAVQYFATAARAGDEASQRELEKPGAKDWLALVERVRAGDAEALFLVGNGLWEIQSNSGKSAAVLSWHESAERGYVPAQRLMGNLYYTGTGVALSRPLAANWYARAANQGDAESAGVLGVMYSNGDGVPRDNAMARQLLVSAARAGSEIARQNLPTLDANIANESAPASPGFWASLGQAMKAEGERVTAQRRAEENAKLQTALAMVRAQEGGSNMPHLVAVDDGDDHHRQLATAPAAPAPRLKIKAPHFENLKLPDPNRPWQSGTATPQ